MQIKSKQRVTDNGEVFTNEREVKAMCDLVNTEINNVESRFLEPTCGEGAFLTEILRRKLNTVNQKYGQVSQDCIKYSIVAIASLYGVDILQDNVEICRQKLYNIWHREYPDADKQICDTVILILNKNIICGDILVRKQSNEEQIKFIKWIFNDDNLLKPCEYELSKMVCENSDFRFDVVIGNPPYQIMDGGGKASATPIYNLFVEQAKELSPKFITMIIPSKWFSGGKGLEKFRTSMLNDDRIRVLVDYTDSKDCFSGVDVAGGVCYFLWDRDNRGKCKVTNIVNDRESVSERYLNEHKVFVRYSDSVSIINKVDMFKEPTMDNMVSARCPFGLPSNTTPEENGDLRLRCNKGFGKISSEKITKGEDVVDKWKVLTSHVSYDHAGRPGKDGKRRVISVIEVVPPMTVCTDTYLVVGSFDNKEYAENLKTYLSTKFVRFLIAQVALAQQISRGVFAFVPVQDFSLAWTDEKLYAKYALTKEEINFIESTIK